MEGLFNFCYYLALFAIPITIYFLYSSSDWYYIIRFIASYLAIKKVQKRSKLSLSNKTLKEIENIQEIQSKNQADIHIFHGIDQNGNSFSLKFVVKADLVAKVFLGLRIASKGVYEFPDDEAIKFYRLSSSQWSVKDLQIEILEPFKHLRIIYNGFLKNLLKSNQVEHVQFNFIWNSAGAPRFYPKDTNPSQLAAALATEHWKDGYWLEFLGPGVGYQQFGSLNGFVRGDSFPNEFYLNLPASRKRCWETDDGLSEFVVVNRYLDLFIVSRNGLLFSICAKSVKNGCLQVNWGNVLLNNGEITAIDATDLRLEHLAQSQSLPNLFSLHIQANKCNFNCIIYLDKSRIITALNDELINITAECNLDNQQAKAVLEFWYKPMKKHNIIIPQPLLTEPVIENFFSNSLISYFDNPKTKITKISGGKGSSLAFLYSLQSHEFKIPPGFVITTEAFRQQLSSDDKLNKAVILLDDIICGRKAGNLKAICEKIMELFENSKLIPELTERVIYSLNCIKNMRSQHQEIHSWAVRSSAIGEDSKELSSAGQNATFLGCCNDFEILKAINLCWASLFSYQSVYYRWQHGLAVKTEMAIVIQKMIAADSAGVLFTCHPITGNPAEIVITSNFGIGESVVSGKSNVDTFVVKCSHKDKVTTAPSNNDLEIQSTILGNKTKLMKLSTTTGLLNELEVLEDSSKISSLNSEQILHLAYIGLLIEQKFDSPRDIEWAYINNKLYLLQSRPITTLNLWSDYELLHEFDSVNLTNQTVYTTANCREVFPNAISALSQSTILFSIDNSLQSHIYDKADLFSLKCIKNFMQHTFIDVIDSFYEVPTKTITISTKIIDLAIFGHIVINEKINSFAIERYGESTILIVLKEFIKLAKSAWFSSQILNEMIIKITNLNIEIQPQDGVEEVYNKIDNYLSNDFLSICKAHVILTSVSVFYQIIAMTVLVERSKELTTDHYADFALLLSTCDNVISAEVPKMLEKIAQLLRFNKKSEEFQTIPPELGVDWLKTNQIEAYKLFEEFLEIHGHRALSELELMNETWSATPSLVISMIQLNCRSIIIEDNKPKKKQQSIDDVIRQLKSPTSNITRSILKFIMSKGRQAVGRREQSKSELVRANNQLRLIYKQLAELMVYKGLLPTKELIYHLTHYEIKQLIDERNPGLVSKALRRQRLYSKCNKMKFPELSFGIPQPIIANEEIFQRNNSELIIICKGTPVCSGEVTGRACVIISLDDINQLQHGDILITYSTDIGWSPYFPMLSGIVTELGGLISHGAVIAREYGLPCIVGITDVIKMFKTGDIVTISGATGVIKLLSEYVD